MFLRIKDLIDIRAAEIAASYKASNKKKMPPGMKKIRGSFAPEIRSPLQMAVIRFVARHHHRGTLPANISKVIGKTIRRTYQEVAILRTKGMLTPGEVGRPMPIRLTPIGEKWVKENPT